jgi:hypothetical protein
MIVLVAADWQALSIWTCARRQISSSPRQVTIDIKIEMIPSAEATVVCTPPPTRLGGTSTFRHLLEEVATASRCATGRASSFYYFTC